MKHSTQLYAVASLFSTIEQGLVMVSYFYMPKWFFWTTFVMWIFSDASRAIRWAKAEKAEKEFQSTMGSRN